jgi:S-DNA-T family DNA segregation ATPase FtsK/SpoIIIE
VPPDRPSLGEGVGASGLAELQAAVDAIDLVAGRSGTLRPAAPWLPALARCDAAELERRYDGVRELEIVGIVDDPAAQAQPPLRWAGRGNLMLVGALGSGTTSALLALGGAWCRHHAVGDADLYVIDARGDERLQRFAGAAHCGAVVGTADTERLHRVLAHLAAEIDHRRDRAAQRPVALLIDGVAVLRSVLADVDRAATSVLLHRVIDEGPAVGLVTVMTSDDAGGGAMAWPVADRWVFHVSDPASARALGVGGPPIASGQPGRLRVASSGLEAQVVDVGTGDVLVDVVDRRHPRSCPTIEVLPTCVDPASLPTSEPLAGGGAALTVGLDAADLRAARLLVPDGEHVLVVGAPRTGRTVTLGRIADAWRDLHPDGAVIEFAGSVRTAPGGVGLDGAGLAAETMAHSARGAVLLVVDDADALDDPTGALARLVTGREPGLTVAVSARLDLRAQYGHWAREVARSRCGVVLTAPGEVDGDLLGATLPRRSLVPARPGLGWVVDVHGLRLVQVAGRLSGCPVSSPSPAHSSARFSAATAGERSSIA